MIGLVGVVRVTLLSRLLRRSRMATQRTSHMPKVRADTFLMRWSLRARTRLQQWSNFLSLEAFLRIIGVSGGKEQTQHGWRYVVVWVNTRTGTTPVRLEMWNRFGMSALHLDNGRDL